MNKDNILYLIGFGAVLYILRLWNVQGLLKNFDVKQKVLDTMKKIVDNSGRLQAEKSIQEKIKNEIKDIQKDNSVSDNELVDFFNKRK